MTYRLSAKFYDLFGAKDDVEFYRGLALQYGPQALEVGVGTGRLAIQLARAGVTVVGLDNSPHMLNIAKAKLAQESAAVRRRVVLHGGDMRNFALQQTFPFVYIPASTFDHNTTVAQQTQTLNCIHQHLEKSGILAFDLAQMPPGKPTTSWWIDRKPIDEERLVVRSIFTRIDRASRTCSLDLFFDEYRQGKLAARYHEFGEVALITKRDVTMLLEETGFTIERLYGGFGKQEHCADSPYLVLVARRKD